MFSRRTTRVVTLVLVALVTVALVATALPVFAHPAAALPAHAQLASTTPKDGATLDTTEQVSLTFSENIDGRFLKLAVEGPDGDEAAGDPTVEDGKITQPLVADLPAGEHTVTYRVVSVDGHPVSGSFTFTTTQGPASASPTPTQSASPTPTATSATPSVTPTPTPSPSTAPTATTEGSSWTLPALLVALVVLVGLAALGLSRRRSGGDGEHPDGSP